MKYHVIIGLEVHITLNTKSKLFSLSPNSSTASPNTNISPYDLGYPGTLPVLNKAAVKKALLLCDFLKCVNSKKLMFDRKHYFHYDLPKGYQITQYFHPIGKYGSLSVNNHQVKIKQVQIEEDTAKQMVDPKSNKLLLDFNRCGSPLVEVVTEPCFQNGMQVVEFLQFLRSALINLNISHATFEDGQMRCDINISLQEQVQQLTNNKVEVKNLNSLKAIQQAIEFETNRQAKLLDNQQKITLETRFFDDKNIKTYVLRRKQKVLDYNFFPEPNLLNVPIKKLRFNQRIVKPETYWAELKFLKDKCHLKFNEIILITKTRNSLQNYLQLAEKCSDVTFFNSWWFNYLFKYLQTKKISLEFQTDLLNLLENIKLKKINPLVVKQNLDAIMDQKINLIEFCKQNQMLQLTADHLVQIIDQAIAAFGNFSAFVKQKPDKAVQYLVGQVMKTTKGQANPQETKNFILNHLKIKL